MKLAVLHPGQMGAAVAAQALTTGATVRWCPTGRSTATAERAATAGLEPITDLGDLLAETDMVISLCPPAAAEDLAHQVAAHDYRGIYVEANAISPQRCTRIAELFPTDSFVDAAVIGPPPRTEVTARLHIAGPTHRLDQITDLFAGSSLHVNTLGVRVGDASALKMAFASYQKASRALAAVAHALARDHGVQDALLTEAHNFTRSPLAQPDYLPSVAARAWRWTPEMLEIAATLEAAGLPDDLACAAAEVLRRWDTDKDDSGLTVAETLERLRDHAGPDDSFRETQPPPRVGWASPIGMVADGGHQDLGEDLAPGHRSRLAHVVIDVADLDAGVAFWSAALGAIEEPLNPASTRTYRRLRLPDTETRVLLQLTQDTKAGKERMHIDIETNDVDAEVQRLEALGAERWNHQQERGFDFWVMHDPWGNELCVLQPEFPELLARRPPWPEPARADRSRRDRA
jgi:3-hydroxyisobutyrate dehydrogenase-like beta-hydroxyacid dehydrogenase/predicted enzyme related to lactoylglutathione lyase